VYRKLCGTPRRFCALPPRPAPDTRDPERRARLAHAVRWLRCNHGESARVWSSKRAYDRIRHFIRHRRVAPSWAMARRAASSGPPALRGRSAQAGVAVVAGVAGFLIGLPLVSVISILPLVHLGAGAALTLGLSVGLGVSAGSRDVRMGRYERYELKP